MSFICLFLSQEKSKKSLKEFYLMISIMILMSLSQRLFQQRVYHQRYYHFSILSTSSDYPVYLSNGHGNTIYTLKSLFFANV